MYFECDELKARIHGQIMNSVKQLIKKTTMARVVEGKGQRSHSLMARNSRISNYSKRNNNP